MSTEEQRGAPPRGQWWAWLVAAAVGVAAALWVDAALWRLAAGAAALAMLAAPRLPRVPRAGLAAARTRLLLLLAVACTLQTTAEDLWRFTTSPWVRVWNVYHYYLGSKYFPELGYHDLYLATLVADEAGPNYWSSISKIRDLETYERVPRAPALAAYHPTEHFSAERWRAFRRDVEALQVHREPDRWRNIFRDRGYNPSPLWTAMGRLLTFQPAGWLWALKLLCALDLLLLAVTFRQIRRDFGARAMAGALLLFALSPVNDGRIVGGFLQYDWFCALGLGLCSLRRGRDLPAAAFFAFAAGTRIFPAILLLSAAVPWAHRAILRRRPAGRDLRLAAALAGCGAVAFGFATVGGGGIDAWRDFASNLSVHAEDHRLGEQRIGLAHAFTHDVRSLDFERLNRSRRRELLDQQQPLYLVAATLLLGLWGAAVWRRGRIDALLLGLAPFFALLVSSRYYWACLALLPLLARPGPIGRRRLRWLTALQAGMLAVVGAAGLRGLEGYGLYTFFDLLLALFLAVALLTYLLADLRARRRRRPLAALHRSRALVAAFFVFLFLLLCWLRLPDPEAPIRDVDEAVSALIAASWLEGGVPYRDAIDQRGPVTYLIYAAVFALAGVHDMVAVHWALLLLILLTCGVTFRFGRGLRPGAAGAGVAYLAALLLAVASFTYRRSQMLAFHTEWPMMLFDALAMLLLWRALRRAAGGGQGRDLVLAGACFALGFLSKQPGIFDAGAGALFVLLWQHRRGALVSRATVRLAALLAAGFFSTLALTAGYFAANGALGDFIFYYWTYNVEHYTAVIPVADRLAALDPFDHGRHYLTANPLLFAGGVASVVAAAAGWLRRRRTDGRLLIALWLLAAYFGASYSGRNFGHYFIQILPPICLATALALADLWRFLSPRARRLRGLGDVALAARGAVAVLAAIALVAPVVRFGDEIGWRNVWRERDERRIEERGRLIEAVRRHSSDSDTLFVWGYYPELYVLTPRRPASRYSNTNYLTGMLPWENHEPGIDTSEHVVESAWEILIEELEAARPRLVVDTAVGDHRYYAKYPIKDFPPLARFLDRHYRPATVVEDRRGRPLAALWIRDE